MGAWIETSSIDEIDACITVAPCMGAWIETPYLLRHLMFFKVAPCMGAWIETAGELLEILANESHPVWVRGLKLLRSGRLSMTICRTLYGCVD